MADWRDRRISLADVADLFGSLEPTVRLEALVEFGRELPPLPDLMKRLRDRGVGLVRECESPVFVAGEVAGDLFRIYADTPLEAPVARGFVGLLIALFANQPVEEIQSAPVQILEALHLAPVLSLRRTRGLNGIYARIRTAAGAGAEGEPGAGPVVR
ncbi:MAG TPA: SufE family protein [Rhodothermales bacterium]